MSTKKDEELWTEISLEEENPKAPTTPPKEEEEIQVESPEADKNPELVVEEKADPPTEEVEEKPAGSRRDKRISALTRKLKEKDEEFARREAELIQRLEAAEKAATDSQSKGLEVAKKALQERMDAAKNKIKAAHESGDSALVAEANVELANTASELAFVGTMTPKVVQQPAPKKAAPATPELPAPAREWLEKNPWYGRGPSQDRAAAAVAVTIGDDLVAEGWDLEDPSYYEELDRRLAEEIPAKMQKLRPPPQEPVKVQRTPVASTSRTAMPTPTGKRPNTVRLSQEEVAIAQRMGMTLQEFAREKLKVEHSTNGYTEIE